VELKFILKLCGTRTEDNTTNVALECVALNNTQSKLANPPKEVDYYLTALPKN